MAIVIQAVEPLSDPGQWLVRAEVDGEPTTCRVASNPDGTCSSMEEGFFLLLSERALAEVRNAAAYHAAVMRLLTQAAVGEPIDVPIVLGPGLNERASAMVAVLAQDQLIQHRIGCSEGNRLLDIRSSTLEGVHPGQAGGG
jgi:hypothetical protein